MPYYGFNFQWMFSRHNDRPPQEPDLKALDFLAETGFTFVRVCTDYRFWTKDFDYFHPDESVFGYIDRYIAASRERGLHFNLNQHRAPGYCINRNDIERHNLWVDKVAQDAFIFLWETFAKRYQGIPSSELSFDLVNEPAAPGQYGMTRENHADLIRRTAAAIWAIDPDRPVTIDGLGGGHMAMPELADLNVTHSGRGYQPMAVSHYKANWWSGHEGLPEPVYPGTNFDGRIWNRESLKEFYQPWRDVEAKGRPIHIGEMGCFNQTPQDVALRWLGDLFSIYREFGWGFSLWNFEGPFGVINHGRPGARYEDYHGYKVDRDLINLMLENKI